MHVDEIPFEVKALLGKVTLPVDAYHHLEVGDILILDQRIASPLPLQVGEHIRFHGYPGLVETSKALQIEKIDE